MMSTSVPVLDTSKTEPKMRHFSRLLAGAVLALALWLTPWARPAAQDTGDLAKAAQNPVAAMISLPFQNNTLFGVGPDADTAIVLNIQPVIPFTVGGWNIINRTIAPVIYLPDLAAGVAEVPSQIQSGNDKFGLGDINHTVYFSPAAAGPVIWGIGPSITLPTATDDLLGSEKWSAGPAAVLLTQPGPWTLGTLVRQLWSFAGDSDRRDVSQLLVQPFVNYNLGGGWYGVSSPVITANWKSADDDDTWTVPVGGGFGRIFSIAGQAMNAQVQSFYNVEAPQYGPDWSLRFQLQFLFPT
jgi:hypothetical protein